MAPLSVTYYSNLADLTADDLRAWEQCVNDAQGSFFQSPRWVILWWKHFGSNSTCALLFVKENSGRVTAVLPGMIVPARWWGKRVRAFTFIGGALNDVNDAVCIPERKESLLLLADALAQKSNTWDILHFKEVPHDSPFLRALTVHPAFLSYDRTYSVTRPRIVKPTHNDTLRRNLPSLSKADINRRYNMLKRSGEVALRFSHAPEETRTVLENFSQMFQRRSDGTGYDSPFPDAVHKAFFSELASSPKGAYRAHIAQLSLPGTPIAYIYWLETPAVRTYYANTFEPSYHHFSPSSILLRELIRDFLTADHRVFDLGRGTMPYKLRFSNEQVSNIQLICARTTAPIRRWATRSAWRVRPLLPQFPLALRVLKNVKKIFFSQSI